jgi:EmrB/QacA subfamily drug resistance transporter
VTSNTVREEERIQRDPRRWWVLGVLCLSLLVLLIDHTVLNLAIPSLMRDLGATTGDIQWILNAYTLVFAGLLLTSGSLSDRYGRRRFLIIGLVIFGGASLATLLATEPWHLIGARAAMGVGGSILMPSTLSILITVFDDEERRKAVAAWSAVAALGMIAGPTLGGFLLEHYWWGSVFLLNVPVAIVAIIAAVALMPESRGPGRPADPLGVALSIVGMTALVYFAISGPRVGWTAPEALAALAVAVLGLTAFAVWELRTEHPMLPLALFRDRAFSASSFSIVLMSFGTGALLLMLTQYLQFVLGYGTMRAAVALMPLAIAGMVFNGVSAALGKRVSNRGLIVTGMLVFAFGFGVLASIDPSSGGWTVIGGLVVMGAGSGLVAPAAYAALMGAVPQDSAGVGSALNDTVQQVGQALSVAVLGSVLAVAYTSAMPDGAPRAARESIGEALPAGDPGLAEAARSAFVSAMSLGSWVGVGSSVAAAVFAWVMLRRSSPVADPAQAVTDAATTTAKPTG